jgi:transposase-like protein
MEVAVFVIIWLALCFAVGFYAEHKGRSGVGLFFLSLLLSPLVGFIAALVMNPDEKKLAAAQGKKRCPQCAEYVQAEAKICRFCQYKFPELTELEQLKASGITAGPACPKCGSVNTFSQSDPTKASHWWNVAKVLRFHCRKCGGVWRDEKSVPVETTNTGLLMTLAFVTITILLLILAFARH